MNGCIEHIRFQIGREPPEVLLRRPWSGTEPSREYFNEIASIALRSYFKSVATVEPKDDFGRLCGKPAAAEAIRFVRANGDELHRYDVHNMLIDDQKMRALQASIATFLRAKQQWPYCNDCIREEFPDAAVEDVARETASMHGQIGFLKDTGICTRCWQQKPVIRAM